MKVKRLARFAATTNVCDVALRPRRVASRVYVPAVVSDSALKIARPCALVAAVVVPLSVPDEMPIVTLRAGRRHDVAVLVVELGRDRAEIVAGGDVLRLRQERQRGRRCRGDGEAPGPETAQSRCRGHEGVCPGQVFGQRVEDGLAGRVRGQCLSAAGKRRPA